MRTKLHTLLVGASCALLPAASALAEFSVLSTASIPNGAEILSFDAASGSVLSTYSAAGGQGVRIYSLSSGGALGAVRDVDLSNTFGTGAAGVYSLSSVVADSQGRDFAAATLIPSNRDVAVGKVVFFQISTGAVLGSVDAGYHPDSVTITPDGSRLVIANEGEYVNATTQTAGSISVVSLAGITNASQLSAITNAAVTTKTFEAANLASGVSIAGLRNNRDTLTTSVVTADRHLDVEPEYITASNDKAYVSLQEANAVAVFDYASGQFTAIHDLGTSTVRMDASDRDPQAGGVTAIKVNDNVAALRMPDTIAKFERGGQTYIVTANEGDFRPDDADRIRYADAVTQGKIDPAAKAALDALYAGNSAASGALGRLRISAIDGDTDNDGDIDVITTISTRGISVINAETGALAFDSASMIEDYVAANDPTTFNVNAEDSTMANFSSTIDGRSPDKGPEIEAVAFGSINGRDYVFAAAERQNGIFAFDITDFGNVAIVDYFNFLTAETAFGDFRAPESLLFISAEDSPTGNPMLIAGFEISGSIAVFDLSGISAIPEPSSVAALAGFGALGLAALRRRRRA